MKLWINFMCEKATVADAKGIALVHVDSWENPAMNFYLHLGAEEFSTKLIEIGGKELEEVALGWKKI